MKKYLIKNFFATETVEAGGKSVNNISMKE